MLEAAGFADRMRRLNNLPPLGAGAGRITATVEGDGLVVLQITSDTDDERLWDDLKRRLETEAALIGQAATAAATSARANTTV